MVFFPKRSQDVESSGGAPRVLGLLFGLSEHPKSKFFCSVENALKWRLVLSSSNDGTGPLETNAQAVGWKVSLTTRPRPTTQDEEVLNLKMLGGDNAKR
jgi:hypothetical protein